MTVLETIQRSTEFLAKKGVESPRLQAELLLAHLLKLPRMRLYLNFEQNLNPSEVESMRELILRRSRREPLQQIVGSCSFCGLEMVANRDVLVPPPETEILAELAWNFLNQLATSQETAGGGAQEAPVVFDYGTGSGCLAVTVAVKCPPASVFATDLSPAAINVARQNATLHGVAERVCFLVGNGFEPLPSDARFDLILSNPPYIPTSEIESLQPEVRDFEPRQALDGGPDGLLHYGWIAAQGQAWLRAGGKLMMEFGDGQADSICDLLLKQNWIVERLVEDYTHRPRIVIAQRNANPTPASASRPPALAS